MKHFIKSQFLSSSLIILVLFQAGFFGATTAQAIGSPGLTSLSPTTGSIGTTVTISGSNLTPTANTINFGSGVIQSISSSSDTSLTFTVPTTLIPPCAYTFPQCPFAQIPTSPGTYNVSVTNSNGTSNALSFNVTDHSSLPVITSLSPTSAPRGTQVTVYGSNFTATNNTVNFGSNTTFPNFNASSVACIQGANCVGPWAVTFTVPYAVPCSVGTCAAYALGDYNVSITNSNGTSNSVVFTIADSSGLVITTASPLPDAQVGTNYLAYIYGQTPLTTGSTLAWSSGSMPPGLTFVPVTTPCAAYQNCAGIGGTPTTAGTFVFTLSLTQGSNSVSKQFSLTVDPATNSGKQKPIGWLDSISPDGFIGGWAIDPDHLNQSIDVHVYFDGSAGSGTIASGSVTDVQRDDVNLIMAATGTHGFRIAVPSSLRDGKKHTAYVYAIDVDDNSGVSNAQLYGSPKVFAVGGTTVKRHAAGTVVIGEGATVYYLGTTLRYPFPSPDVFFSWGHTFSQLFLANAADLAMPIGPVVGLKP